MDTQKQSPDSANSQTYHFSLFLFLLFLFYPLCSCLLPIIEFLYLCYLLFRFQSFPTNIVPFIQFKNSIKKPGGGKKNYSFSSTFLSFSFFSFYFYYFFFFNCFSSSQVSLPSSFSVFFTLLYYSSSLVSSFFTPHFPLSLICIFFSLLTICTSLSPLQFVNFLFPF